MKHLTTVLFILLSFSLFGQDGGADQIKLKTDYLELNNQNLVQLSSPTLKVLAIDSSDMVGYTTTLPGGESLWNNNGNYIEYHEGDVRIGAPEDTLRLFVSGKIYTTEVYVRTTVPAPDYVFEKDYRLTSLDELESYLEKHKHLPEIPSAKEMENVGINVSEMNMLLLKKVEELTLYVINQQKKIEELKKQIIEKN